MFKTLIKWIKNIFDNPNDYDNTGEEEFQRRLNEYFKK